MIAAKVGADDTPAEGVVKCGECARGRPNGDGRRVYCVIFSQLKFSNLPISCTGWRPKK